MLAFVALLVTKPFFASPFLLGAHRGGVSEVPENTKLAFETTARRYPMMLLETDVRITKDGQLVLLHDETVDRTTNGTGKIGDLTLDQVRKLDAGFRFSLDSKTYPFRGKSVRIATLEEALRAAPQNRFELDLKSAEVAEKAAAVIRRLRAEDRVLLASFVPAAMAKARELLPNTAFCYDFNSGARLLLALRGPNWDRYQPEADVLSMMKEQVEQYRISPTDIAKIRAKGIRFQIHTLNDAEEIRKWLGIGVDSILTDAPSLLTEEAMALPMARAHSHNDYEQTRPLFDAMDQGFASVEADIYLQDGELRVAHDRKGTKPGRTLEKLYLEPLWRAYQANKETSNGIYPWRSDFQLLIDIKEDGERVYQELKRRIVKYRPMLRRLVGGEPQPGCVTLVLSGSRPTESLPKETTRDFYLDGRAADPEPLRTSRIAPLTSDSYFPTFRWLGRGQMPEEERTRLRQMVEEAHRRGQKIRFWGVPDTPDAWREMWDAGVDYINTDHLAGLAEFLRRSHFASPTP